VVVLRDWTLKMFAGTTRTAVLLPCLLCQFLSNYTSIHFEWDRANIEKCDLLQLFFPLYLKNLGLTEAFLQPLL